MTTETPELSTETPELSTKTSLPYTESVLYIQNTSDWVRSILWTTMHREDFDEN